MQMSLDQLVSAPLVLAGMPITVHTEGLSIAVKRPGAAQSRPPLHPCGTSARLGVYVRISDAFPYSTLDVFDQRRGGHDRSYPLAIFEQHRVRVTAALRTARGGFLTQQTGRVMSFLGMPMGRIEIF